MVTQSVPSPRKEFAGRITVNRSFNYTVKITEFQLYVGESNNPLPRFSTETLGWELKPTDRIARVEMKFEITSARRSMRKTCQTLDQVSIKHLLGLEAQKYAKVFVRSLKDGGGKSLHLEFDPQKLHLNPVKLAYGSDGCPVSAVVRVESQDFAKFKAVYASVLSEALGRVS